MPSRHISTRTPTIRTITPPVQARVTPVHPTDSATAADSEEAVASAVEEAVPREVGEFRLSNLRAPCRHNLLGAPFYCL